MSARKEALRRAAPPPVPGLLPGQIHSVFAMDRVPGLLPGQVKPWTAQEAPGAPVGQRSAACGCGPCNAADGQSAGNTPAASPERDGCHPPRATLPPGLPDWRLLRGTPQMGPDSFWAPERQGPLLRRSHTRLRFGERRRSVHIRSLPGPNYTGAMAGSIAGANPHFNPGAVDAPVLYDRAETSEQRPGFTIDLRGPEGNCSEILSVIVAALDYIDEHLDEIQNSSIQANQNSANCRNRRNTTRFGGHAQEELGTTSPREVVRETLYNEDIRFRIDCKSESSARDCRPVNGQAPWAFVRCTSQWNDPVKDLHICKDFVESYVNGSSIDDAAPRLAQVIVHEIMHIWGADEPAAQSAEPGWP